MPYVCWDWSPFIKSSRPCRRPIRLRQGRGGPLEQNNKRRTGLSPHVLAPPTVVQPGAPFPASGAAWFLGLLIEVRPLAVEPKFVDKLSHLGWQQQRRRATMPHTFA